MIRNIEETRKILLFIIYFYVLFIFKFIIILEEKEQKKNDSSKQEHEIPQDIQDMMNKFKKQAANTARVNETPNIVYSKGQSMAYIAHRVPGIFGCNVRTLSEVNK